MNMVNNKIGGGYTLSVVVPVYNSEKTIVECVNSIRNQTYKNIEIICVNDGSTDNSLQILNDLAKEDSRIIVINQLNGGVSAARNKGIDTSNADYITFVDSDDTIESTMYEKMMQKMVYHSADCVICGSKEYKAAGNVVCYSVPYANTLIENHNEIIQKIVAPALGHINGNVPICVSASVWNKIFSKEILNENKIRFNESRRFGEDWQFCLEYFSHSNSIYMLNEMLYRYIHQNNESLVTKTRFDFLETCFLDRNMFRKLFPELNWEKSNVINDYIQCPIKAAHYYRVRLNGKALKNKLSEMYPICKNDKLFCQYIAKHGGLYNICFRHPFWFEKYIILRTNTKVIKTKIILFLSKIKKSIKNKRTL